MEKITRREMCEAVISLLETGEQKYPQQAVVDFFTKEIETLEKRASKAKERASEKKATSDELYSAVLTALSTTSFETIADIATLVDLPEATPAKVTYRLTQLIKNNLAEKQEITIPAAEGQKARKAQGYRAIVAE